MFRKRRLRRQLRQLVREDEELQLEIQLEQSMMNNLHPESLELVVHDRMLEFLEQMLQNTREKIQKLEAELQPLIQKE